MELDFPLVPDIKLMHSLKPLFAKNCQFSINFITDNWSQFGIIEPKTAHKVILVEREIYPDANIFRVEKPQALGDY